MKKLLLLSLSLLGSLTYGQQGLYTLDAKGDNTTAQLHSIAIIKIDSLGDTIFMHHNFQNWLRDTVDWVSVNNFEIDTFEVIADEIRLSIKNDGQPYKSIDLSGYINTDNQNLSNVLGVGNDAGALAIANVGAFDSNNAIIGSVATAAFQGIETINLSTDDSWKFGTISNYGQIRHGNDIMTAWRDIGGESWMGVNVIPSGHIFHVKTLEGVNAFTIEDATGDVGIGKTSAAYKLDVNGTTNTTGFRMPTGAVDGYALITDGVGVGTWTSLASYLDNTDTQLTQEQVEDFSFDPLRHGTGTQTRIAVTYDDVNNNVDYIVDGNLSSYTNDAGFLTDDVTTTFSNLQAGKLIGRYTNEDGTIYDLDETVTSLTALNDTLFYDKETSGVSDTISLLSYLDNTDDQTLSEVLTSGNNAGLQNITGVNNFDAELIGINTAPTALAKIKVQADATGGRSAAHFLGGDGGATIGVIIDGDGDATDILLKVRSNGTATPIDSDMKFVVMGDGKTGIGTSTPTQKLEVAGNIKMVDGLQALNKVMTSDANGVGSWQTIAGSTDDQNLDVGTFTSGTGILDIGIENGTDVSIDLSYLDNTGTDDQTLAEILAVSTDANFLGITNLGNTSMYAGDGTTLTIEELFGKAYFKNASFTGTDLVRFDTDVSGTDKLYFDFGQASTTTGELGLRVWNGAVSPSIQHLLGNGNSYVNVTGGNFGVGTASPLFKADVNGTFSANSININDAFTFPTVDGTVDQVLKTNGVGVLSWATSDLSSTNEIQQLHILDDNVYIMNSPYSYPTDVEDQIDISGLRNEVIADIENDPAIGFAGAKESDLYQDTDDKRLHIKNPFGTWDELFAQDGDGSATNEHNTGVALVGDNLQVTDGGGTLSTSLAVYLDNTDDWTNSVNDIYNANSGNVGIGSTNPSALLHVSLDGGTMPTIDALRTAALFSNNSSSGDDVNISIIAGTNIGGAAIHFGDLNNQDQGIINYVNTTANTTDYMFFSVNAAEKMRIQANGDIGIGKTPTEKLDVLGTVRSESPAFLSSFFEGLNSLVSPITVFKMLEDDDGDGQLSIYDKTGTENFRINGAGNSFFTGNNFGIGTNVPTSKLHTVGDALFVGTGGNFEMEASGTVLNFVNDALGADMEIDNSGNNIRFNTTTQSGFEFKLQSNLVMEIPAGLVTDAPVNIKTFTTLSPRATIPTASSGVVYMDDGTNTTDGNPHLRYYSGATLGWIEL